MTKVTKERIAEIRARLEYEETQFYDVSPSRIGRQYCGDVAALLDALEEAQALLNKSADRTAWLIEENERLRKTAEYGEHLAMIVHLDVEKSSDTIAYTKCYRCKQPFVIHIDAPMEGQHADDCPFKILEDAPAQDDRWNWHKACRVCGMMFRKIDGVWTGNHKGWCDFAKAKGGDSS